MSRIKYIAMPDQTPDTRNDGFYKDISHDWQKRARNLRERRLEEIEHKRKF